VTGGLSYGRFEDHPGNDADYDTTLWTVGGGYMFGPFDLLLPDIAVRTELVFRGDMHDGEKTSETFNNALNELVASVGLMIPLGSVPAPPAPPPEPPAEVVAVVAPVDSDGDGVTDDLDKCPDTPAGTAVDADGCPLPALAPECKTPEPGQPITLEGCAAGDKIVLRGVNFEFDRAQLTANAKTILDGVADALNSAPNVRVEVGGHTDGKGGDEYNQKLSDRRAASVLQYLIGKGIDTGRMESRGYGESEPVSDNDSDEGRELNRRVELKIIN
jgi:OOP family OmpA-OmpF porin